MGRLKVHPAPVDDKTGAQILGTHGRALDVPSGKSPSPRGGPLHERLGFRLDPKREVEPPPLLVLPVQLAGTLQQVFQFAVCKHPVIVCFTIFLHVEVNGAVYLVREAPFHDFLYHLDLLQDMAGGGGLDAGKKGVEKREHLVKTEGILLDNLHRLQLFQLGPLGKLVVPLVTIPLQVPRVGDVTHVTHLVTQVQQVTIDHVERDERAAVSQVDIAIHGGSANVHPYHGRMQRLKRLFRPAERVVYDQFFCFFVVHKITSVFLKRDKNTNLSETNSHLYKKEQKVVSLLCCFAYF